MYLLTTEKGGTYLSLSADLSAKIKKIIGDSHGSYETITEFVRDAVREKIEAIEYNKQPK